MNGQLTRREKILLYALLCFLIVMGGLYLLVMPAAQRYMEKQEAYGEIRLEVTMHKQAIAGLDATRQALERNKAAAVEKSGVFYEKMTNTALNTALNEIVMRHGMTLSGIIMQDTQEASLTEFWTREEIAAAKAQTTQTGSPVQPASRKALTNYVTMKVDGTGVMLVDLLTELDGLPAVHLVSVSMQDGNLATAQSFSLNVAVYMLEPIAS